MNKIISFLLVVTSAFIYGMDPLGTICSRDRTPSPFSFQQSHSKKDDELTKSIQRDRQHCDIFFKATQKITLPTVYSRTPTIYLWVKPSGHESYLTAKNYGVPFIKNTYERNSLRSTIKEVPACPLSGIDREIFFICKHSY